MLNILIVDDSEVDRLLMDGLLKRSIGFEVLWAENGRQAIERFRDWEIDLVITDLQMPEVDGLELVRQVRQSHPEVPIVLTTGKGSEEIAAMALNEGAAGYVPKSHLSTMLVPTVRGILNTFQAGRQANNMLRHADEAQFVFTLGNDPAQFAPLIAFCERQIRKVSRVDRVERLRIAIALHQALHNALYRGNLEITTPHKIPLGERIMDEELESLIEERRTSDPWQNRKIQVTIRLTPRSFTARIRDEGPGFDPEQFGDWKQSDSRGIILMRSFVDELRFNERGNEVAMRRRLKRQRKTTETAAADDSADSSPALLGTLHCEKTGNTIALKTDRFLIGRRESCHLVLPFQSVAETHCLLVYENGRWHAKNMDSDNGTCINGQPFEYQPVQPGDQISIGTQDFRIDY